MAKRLYKDDPESVRRNYALIKDEMSRIKRRAAEVAEKLSDPIYQASLMKALVDERENTNRILKNIYAKIEDLERRIKRLEVGEATREEGRTPPLLSRVDERILRFVRDKGRVSASDVKRRFGYKGTNAASARLNKLYAQGLLNKMQAGRVVYYFLR